MASVCIKMVAKIFVTILFMPILELFLSIFHCQASYSNGSTTSTNESSTTVESTTSTTDTNSSTSGVLI